MKVCDECCPCCPSCDVYDDDEFLDYDEEEVDE